MTTEISELSPTEHVKQLQKGRMRKISSIVRRYKSEPEINKNDLYIKNRITGKPLTQGIIENDIRTVAEITHSDSDEQWRVITNKAMVIKKVDNSRLPIKRFGFVFRGELKEDIPKMKIPQLITKKKQQQTLVESMINHEMKD